MPPLPPQNTVATLDSQAVGPSVPTLPQDLSSLETLLEHPQAPELVTQLPSTHIHRLVCQIGRHDTTALLTLASPEQVREVLDLELWDGDRLKCGETLDWLRYLGTLPFAVCRRDFQTLDREIIGLLLKSHVKTYIVQDETTPEEPEGVFYETPDGVFILDVIAEDQGTTEHLIILLKMMYRMDHDDIHALLLELMWSLPSELEELAFRWRNNRLQDLGFADPQEALLIYAYLDPSTVDPHEGTTERLTLIDEELPRRTELVQLSAVQSSFWHQAVRRVEDPAQLERLAQFLMVLSNWCLSADRISPADLAESQRSLERLHWRLSLGLEHLSGGDLPLAEEVLASVALLRIARVGHSLTLDLRRRLLSPLRHGALGHEPGRLELLDQPLRTQIAAVALARPLYHEAPDREQRMFQSCQDLVQAGEWIDTALAMPSLLEQMKITLPDSPPDKMTAGDLYRTSVANRLLHREGPLDRAALADFLRTFEPEVVDPLSHPDTLSAPEVRLLESWQTGLLEVTRRLNPEDLDLRFVDGFWVT